MATYVPLGFRVISALSGFFSAFSGPTTVYTAPANSVAFLNIFFSVNINGATETLSIGGVTMITISRTSSSIFVTSGAELFAINGGNAPPSSAAFLAVVGPGQSVVRSSANAQVVYSGVLLGT